jgi:hypothetical protein
VSFPSFDLRVCLDFVSAPPSFNFDFQRAINFFAEFMNFKAYLCKIRRAFVVISANEFSARHPRRRAGCDRRNVRSAPLGVVHAKGPPQR